MHAQHVKILGMGKYLPKQIVASETLDEKIGLSKGWSQAHTGVRFRHYVEDETASSMGALAATAALQDANLTASDIDCIVCASGGTEQLIPCTASLIHAKLGSKKPGIPAFDINSTCLSFLTALDILAPSIASGRFNKVLIVSSEIASVGLNWNDRYSAPLFGDGAAAIILGQTPENESSKILASAMNTYSEGVAFAEIRGGGSRLHSREYSVKRQADFLFAMDGKKIYRLAAKYIPALVSNLLAHAQLTLDDIAMIIPHQASSVAMSLTQEHLNIPESKFMRIIHNHGNTIAASLPMTLYEAARQNKMRRGDPIMLLGTSAGLSIGAMILEY